jgi:hypothetical protein
VLQHTTNPIAILKYLYEQLPPGGQIFVVEEDDGFFKCFPDCPAFYQVVDIWKKVCDHEGTVRYLGREIPELLTKAGFQVKRAKVLLHNNFEIGPDLLEYLIATVQLLHYTCPQLVEASEVDRIRGEFERYTDRHGDSWFAVYPEILTMGVKTL